jgi:RNA polymerase sigma-70 factor (ECF subfamily)
LREDVALEMPPLLTWFAGREAVTRFVAAQLLIAPGLLRAVPVRANGQPAFAIYQRASDGAYRAHAVLVLTLTGTEIARIVSFQNADLFRSFGLPQEDGAAGLRPAQDQKVFP